MFPAIEFSIGVNLRSSAVNFSVGYQGDRLSTLKILVFLRRRQVSLEDVKLLRPLKGQFRTGCLVGDDSRSANAAGRTNAAADAAQVTCKHQVLVTASCSIAEEFLATRCSHGGGTADGGNCLNAHGGKLASHAIGRDSSYRLVAFCIVPVFGHLGNCMAVVRKRVLAGICRSSW